MDHALTRRGLLAGMGVAAGAAALGTGMGPAGAALQHVPMPDCGEPGGPGPFSFADADRLRFIASRAFDRSVDAERYVNGMQTKPPRQLLQIVEVVAHRSLGPQPLRLGRTHGCAKLNLNELGRSRHLFDSISSLSKLGSDQDGPVSRRPSLLPSGATPRVPAL